MAWRTASAPTVRSTYVTVGPGRSRPPQLVVEPSLQRPRRTRARRVVALLVNQGNAAQAESVTREAKIAAHRLGLELHVLNASGGGCGSPRGGSAVAWPPSARAQHQAMPVISDVAIEVANEQRRALGGRFAPRTRRR
jgi:hypothetical protein